MGFLLRDSARRQKLFYFIMKQCTKCNRHKELTEFCKQKAGEYGLQSHCKDCNSDIMKNYRRTVPGMITQIYGTQRKSSIRRNHKMPTYTKKEFKKWILSQNNFKELYNNWVVSDYNKMLRPSVDRLDDYKGYSFDNIQLITWGENDKKGKQDRKSGKPVSQYTLEDNLISNYYSMMEGARQTGVSHGSIWSACQGRLKTAGGYKWKYKTCSIQGESCESCS